MGPEKSEFSLLDGAFLSLVAEGTELHAQEGSMDLWYVRASWSDVRAAPCELSPSGLHLCVIASATVSDTCNESVNPFVTRS